MFKLEHTNSAVYVSSRKAGALENHYIDCQRMGIIAPSMYTELTHPGGTDPLVEQLNDAGVIGGWHAYTIHLGRSRWLILHRSILKSD